MQGLTSEGLTLTGASTVNTAAPRSGGACASFAPSAQNRANFIFSTTLGRAYFLRVAFRVNDATPSANMTLLGYKDATGTIIELDLKTSGAMSGWNPVGSAAVGADSPAISVDTWYVAELKALVPSSGNGTVAWRIFNNNGSLFHRVDDITTVNLRNSGITSLVAGHETAAETTTTVLIDDMALNDDQGANQNSWPGPAKVVLLKPTSDNALGTGWEAPQTVGSDVTGIYDAVNNTPGLGVAHSDVDANNLKYIFNIASNAATNYDANLTTYTAAGVGANDQVVLVQPLANTGSNSTTDTAGAVAMVSNPASASETAFTAFDEVIVAGVWPAGWGTRKGAAIYNPAVVLGTSPVARVGKRTANTNAAMVDFLGAYVEYAPRKPIIRARQAAVATPAVAVGGVYIL